MHAQPPLPILGHNLPALNRRFPTQRAAIFLSVFLQKNKLVVNGDARVIIVHAVRRCWRRRVSLVRDWVEHVCEGRGEVLPAMSNVWV
jgi:transposase InsO family protein